MFPLSTASGGLRAPLFLAVFFAKGVWGIREQVGSQDVDEVSEDSNATSASIGCCCDYGLGVEGQKCKYVLTPNGCPRADFGRGTSQTHSYKDAKSIPSRCELTPAARDNLEPQDESLDRMKCKVEETADVKYFPPETHGDFSINFKMPAVPGVGDLFLAIKDIHIMQVSLKMHYWRKNDDTFSFRVQGMNGHDKAVVIVYLKDFLLKVPDATFVQMFANLANLDNTPVHITMGMSGDFKRSRSTKMWEVVKGTTTQFADVSFGSGGLFTALINACISAFGGMDQIFFDIVFPLVQQLIPPNLGEAFETVPSRDGQLDNSIELLAVCALPSGQLCPSEELRVTLDMVSEVRMRPQPILHDMTRLRMFEYDGVKTPLGRMADNVLAAYDRGGRVFFGANGSATLDASLASPQGFGSTATPSLVLPMPLLEGILGPELSQVFRAFLPEDGQSTTFSGRLDVSDGAITLQDLAVDHLKLPLGADPDSFLQFNASVEELTVELDDAGGEDPGIIFEEGSPLGVTAPGLLLALSSAGISVTAKEDFGVQVGISQPWITNTTKAFAMGMRVPVSVRNESWELADGVVPEQFQRPFSQNAPYLDLVRFLKNVSTGVAVEIRTQSSESPSTESVDLAVRTNVRGKFHLGSPFWKSVIQAVPADWGYLYSTVPGYYGKLGSGDSPPTNQAFAMLSCGYLKIYKLEDANIFKSGPATPFDNSPSVTLNLNGITNPNLLQVKRAKGGHHCIVVDVEFFGGKVYFCSKGSARGERLSDAIRMQKTRMVDASTRWRAACVPGFGGGQPLCKASPDGTWFQRIDIKDSSTYFPSRLPPKSPADVSSPFKAWNDAVKELY